MDAEAGIQPAFQPLEATEGRREVPGVDDGGWKTVEHWVAWPDGPDGVAPEKGNADSVTSALEAQAIAADIARLRAEGVIEGLGRGGGAVAGHYGPGSSAGGLSRGRRSLRGGARTRLLPPAGGGRVGGAGPLRPRTGRRARAPDRRCAAMWSGCRTRRWHRCGGPGSRAGWPGWRVEDPVAAAAVVEAIGQAQAAAAEGCARRRRGARVAGRRAGRQRRFIAEIAALAAVGSTRCLCRKDPDPVAGRGDGRRRAISAASAGRGSTDFSPTSRRRWSPAKAGMPGSPGSCGRRSRRAARAGSRRHPISRSMRSTS